MVANVGMGLFCLSWLAQGSTYGWEVESPNRAPRGIILEIKESIARGIRQAKLHNG